MLFMLTIFAVGCGSDGDVAVPAETTAPTVAVTNPAAGATGAILNSSITALFSEELDSASIAGTFTLTTTADPATAIAGTLDYAGKTMVFNPTADLNASTPYTATITTGVKDLAGNAMAAEYSWSFTTGTSSDSTAPTVTSTDPAAAATDVVLNKNITALFSEPLDPTTVTAATFTLRDNTHAATVSGTVSYVRSTMVFNASSDLAPGSNFTATITVGVKDLAGVPIAAPFSWSFDTGTTVATGPAPVNLGTAGNFAILAKTAISTTRTGIAGVVTGNIGVSPNDLTAITGFTKVLDGTGVFATAIEVVGKLYAAAMTAPTPSNMTTAVSDMETAYTDAAGRSLPDYTELGAGNVSGMTLSPGLYKWGTGLLITNAGVTLSGSATDVWIFQIDGDLTLETGAIVTLAGSALPENIFWQVAGGTGVTLNSGADFKGIVLAQKAIIVGTTAVVNGRLLAQTAVTANGTSVTQP